MNEVNAKEVSLEPFRIMLASEAGGLPPLAICDEAGVVLAAADDASPGITSVIDELVASGFCWESNHGERRRTAPGERELVFRELSSSSRNFGWIAALVPASTVEDLNRFRRLETSLDALADSVSEQLRLTLENSSLAFEVARRYEELSVVYSLDDIATRSRFAASGIQTLLENLAVQVNVDLAVFVDSDQTTPVFAHADNANPIPYLDLFLTELRGDLFRFVAVDRRPLILNMADDPRREYLIPHSRYKILAAPVERSDFRGLLVMLRREDRPDFENSDRALAQVLAQQIGTTRRNELLLGSMQQFGEQLAGMLIEAMEAKDPYTRGHSERVQVIAVQIGRALDLAKSDLRDLFWGSILHDVGKIGIPDAILLKPGKLTSHEYTFIKTHPQRSFDILSHIDYLNSNMLEGARFHHERIDGRGYPLGLEGSRIPIHARVIAVADAYDAMTSSRSYRQAMSHDTAMEQIAEVSGTQLDSEFTSAFEKLCKDDPAWLERAAVSPDDSDD